MAESVDNTKYIDALEALRGFMRMNQAEFAEVLGKSRTFVSTMERTRYLPEATLEEILTRINKTRQELLDWYDSSEQFVEGARQQAS